MKTELNAIQPKVVFRGSLFFASLYIFKVGLYLTGFIDLSLLLNLLGFTAVCLYFNHKYLNKLYRTIAVILTFALFYHDSYLPSVEQMIAQRNNLTDFSLGYIVEFIEGFINLKMIFAFILAIIILYFSSRFVRVITVTYVLIMATVVTPDDFFKNIIDNDDSIKVNENFIATKINKGLVEQRGNFTKTNLQRYLETFYEKESERKIDFPTHLRKNFKPFNIVVLQVNSMSNKDLYVHNAKEHAVLKRFDIYLSDFNSATTDKNEATLRLFDAVCGQKSRDELLKDNKNCSLFRALERLGYSGQYLFDRKEDNLKVAKFLQEKTVFPLAKIETKEKPNQLLSTLNRIDVMYEYIEAQRLEHNNQMFSFLRTTLADNVRGETEYDLILKNFLLNLDKFVDYLSGLPNDTLFVLIPADGSALQGDRTQLKGVKEIPSHTLTNVTAMVKFISHKQRASAINVTSPTSYMGIAHLIKRAIDGNVFYEDNVMSNLALTEDLSQTSPVSENEQAVFLKFKDRFFYKSASEGWTQYTE